MRKREQTIKALRDVLDPDGETLAFHLAKRAIEALPLGTFAGEPKADQAVAPVGAKTISDIQHLRDHTAAIKDGTLSFSTADAQTRIVTFDDRLYEFFNWPNVVQEAKARLIEARQHGQNIGEKDTLEYWAAWCAHMNLAACVSDLINRGQKP